MKIIYLIVFLIVSVFIAVMHFKMLKSKKWSFFVIAMILSLVAVLMSHGLLYYYKALEKTATGVFLGFAYFGEQMLFYIARIVYLMQLIITIFIGIFIFEKQQKEKGNGKTPLVLISAFVLTTIGIIHLGVNFYNAAICKPVIGTVTEVVLQNNMRNADTGKYYDMVSVQFSINGKQYIRDTLHEEGLKVGDSVNIYAVKKSRDYYISFYSSGRDFLSITSGIVALGIGMLMFIVRLRK